jgi:hypothetical protein
MLDVAIRRIDGQTVVDLGRTPASAAPPLPVSPALAGLLPSGLRRGSTLAVSGSMSLLLALLAASSAAGAWCALVGLAPISAEAAAEQGIDLSRLAIVPALDPATPSSAHSASQPSVHPTAWTTAVGALLDAVDIVAARPPQRMAPGDVRRLSARARTHDSVLVCYLDAGESWPGSEVTLRASDGCWSGIGAGYGRLKQRRLTVQAQGRGQAARPRSATLWLPSLDGGIEPADEPAAVVRLPTRAS